MYQQLAPPTNEPAISDPIMLKTTACGKIVGLLSRSSLVGACVVSGCSGRNASCSSSSRSRSMSSFSVAIESEAKMRRIAAIEM